MGGGGGGGGVRLHSCLKHTCFPNMPFEIWHFPRSLTKNPFVETRMYCLKSNRSQTPVQEFCLLSVRHIKKLFQLSLADLNEIKDSNVHVHLLVHCAFSFPLEKCQLD